MTYKACNDKECTSDGAMLEDEDFPLRAGGVFRSGICRVCTSRKAKAKRKAKKHSQHSQKHVAKCEDKQKRDTDLFNAINRRW